MDPRDMYLNIEGTLEDDARFLTLIGNGKCAFSFQDLIDMSIDLYRASFLIKSLRGSQFVLSEIPILDTESLPCENEV